MKMRRMINKFKKQCGFTLVELLISLVIIGLVVSATGSAFYQVLLRSGPADSSLQAINNVQNAGEWVSRDAANSETVDVSSGYPVFIWHDYGYTDDAHKTTVTYSVSSDGSLMRTVQYGVSAGILPILPQNTIYASKKSQPEEAKGSSLIVLSISPLKFVFEQAISKDRFAENPQIWTDKQDYAPGEMVQVNGKGFWPGEPIHLFAVGSPNGLHFEGKATANENGYFTTTMHLPNAWDATYILTAAGGNSNITARTNFTDGSWSIQNPIGAQVGTLTRGTAGSATFVVKLSATGSAYSVTMSVSGLPSGASGSFSPNPASVPKGGSVNSTLTVNTTTSTPAGTYTITVKGTSGSTNITATGTLTINKTSSTTSVATSSNPATYGQTVTFTSTVSPSTATGTVTFKDGSNTLGTGTLSSGVATYATSALTVGSHSITAVYGGDSSYATSTSSILTQTVNSAGATTTLISSANPSNYGQSLNFTASVSGSAGTPTGTVQFKTDGTNFGSPVTLSGGSATSGATATLSVGNHTISAVYSGDSKYSGSTGTLTQIVNSSVATVAITSSTNPSTYNQSVTFTSTVSGPAGTPSGTVQFMIDGSNFGSPVTLSGGTVNSNAISNLSVGNHTINAVYSGDSAYSSNVSTLSGGQTVNLLSSATAVTSLKNPASPSDAVTFTATVSPSGATGTVQFKVDGSNFGVPVMLVSGTANSDTTSSLATGTHTITAVYSGDLNYNASTATLMGGEVINILTSPTPTNGESLIAKHITMSNLQVTSGVLSLTITSTVGTGSNQKTETRNYQITLRNYHP
jgi:prepilin-type N-terminal cleavage/methylation domain-containing protein